MNMLGIPLESALERLKPLDQPIELVEVSSRKGSKGDDRRVIRVDIKDDRIIVYWSRFQTDAAFHSEGAEPKALHRLRVEKN